MNSDPQKVSSYASRGGDKLVAALQRSGLSVKNMVVADFGSSTGGFVDVLLQQGASQVYAVEIGRGLLDWRLRNDPRVIVLERTDARSVELPEHTDLITADVGFAKQGDFIPNALKLSKPRGLVVSLIKPQYEVSGRELVRGRLTDELSVEIVERVVGHLRTLECDVLDLFPSAVKGKDAKVQEFFVVIRAR